MWCGCGRKKKKKGRTNDAFSDDDDGYYYSKAKAGSPAEVRVTRVFSRVKSAFLPKKKHAQSPQQRARARTASGPSGPEDRRPYEAVGRPHDTQSSASQSVGSLADILLYNVSLPSC